MGVGTGKSVRGFVELEEFELGRQLLMLKHRYVQGTSKLLRVRENFNLREFELSRFHCSPKLFRLVNSVAG